MRLFSRIIQIKKRFPLTISRGTHTGSSNLFVVIDDGEHKGIGEMSPSKDPSDPNSEDCKNILNEFWKDINPKLGIKEIWQLAKDKNIAPYAIAALDIALWDLKGKKQNESIRTMLNMPLPSAPTSITLGIMSPEEVAIRIPLLFENQKFKSLKVKLGSPDGIEFDKAMFSQALESSKEFDVICRVDANGGWNLEQAKRMTEWLAERNVDYIEQPLAKGDEGNLKNLYKNRALPIYVDESCNYAEDIEEWHEYVDGVNIKLMKCGGITGAVEILESCKTHNLKSMIGCMGESSVSISAAAQISGVIQHIDLDSHLNLSPDPATGAELIDGILMPNDLPGHGAKLK
tara:strand:+ start:632 stop:1666 length:1035 start_codon:yes stop_codon:yes gene_type:complete